MSVSTNDSDIAGWTADEILRNFLEVASPTDLATAEDVRRLQELWSKDKLTSAEAEELEQLRHTVNRDLLRGPVAAQVEQFAEMLRQAGIGLPAPSEPPDCPIMHWVNRGQEPDGLESVRIRYTPRWVEYYTLGTGTKPQDSAGLTSRVTWKGLSTVFVPIANVRAQGK